MVAPPLKPGGGSDTHVVVPAPRSRTKTWVQPPNWQELVPRLEAAEVKATRLPSAEMDGV